MDLIEVSEVMMRLWGGGIIADASVSLKKLRGQQQPSDGVTKTVEMCTAELLLLRLSGLPGNRHMEINFCHMYPLLRLCQLKSHVS